MQKAKLPKSSEVDNGYLARAGQGGALVGRRLMGTQGPARLQGVATLRNGATCDYRLGTQVPGTLLEGQGLPLGS